MQINLCAVFFYKLVCDNQENKKAKKQGVSYGYIFVFLLFCFFDYSYASCFCHLSTAHFLNAKNTFIDTVFMLNLAF